MGGKQRRSSLHPTQSGRRIFVVRKVSRAAKKMSRDTHSRKFATDPRRHSLQEKEEEERRRGSQRSSHSLPPFGI